MDTNLQCHNCGAKPNGLMDIGDGRLCLGCYSQYTQAQYMASQAMTAKLSELMAAQSWANDMIEYQLGFRNTPPQNHSPSRNTIMNQNFNLSNSAIGIINTGKINADSIKSDVNINNSSGFTELENSLNNLLIEVNNSTELDNDRKICIIESASLIKQELSEPSQQRKTTVIKSMMSTIDNLTKGVRNIETLWNICHPLIVSALAMIRP